MKIRGDIHVGQKGVAEGAAEFGKRKISILGGEWLKKGRQDFVHVC